MRNNSAATVVAALCLTGSCVSGDRSQNEGSPEVGQADAGDLQSSLVTDVAPSATGTTRIFNQWCDATVNCDDGNYCNGAETCIDNACTAGSPRCDFQDNLVFTTSTAYGGNLGGLVGANALCQARANAGSATAPLGRTWVAFLSSTSSNARDAIEWSSGPLKNVLGETVHAGPTASQAVWPWPALPAALRYDENGNSITTSINQWSGSSVLGTYGSGIATCSNWTSSSSLLTGRTGDISSQSSGGLWIDNGANGMCSIARRLVCISQAQPNPAVTRLRSSTGTGTSPAYSYWANNTYAASCEDYRSPSSGKAYYGATGSNLYAVSAGGGVWLTWCDMGGTGVTAKSCKVIKDRVPAATTTDYYVQPPGGSVTRVSCDMTTDGGGWQLMLAYNRAANTNPVLNPGLVPNGQYGFRHKYLGAMGYDITDVAEVRFWCNTSAHSRVIHFKTMNSDVKYSALLGTNSSPDHTLDPPDFNSGYLAMNGHTGYLPAATDLAGWSATDVFAWIPFGTNDGTSNGRRWDIRRSGTTWLCDNVLSGSTSQTKATHHQAWFRGAAEIVTTEQGRRWSDGSYATSCSQYRYPTGAYAYTGDIGNGVYALMPMGGGPEYAALCDMEVNPGTLVFTITDEIFDFYASNGGELGYLGIPTANATVLGDGGRVQTFVGGRWWATATNVYKVPGTGIVHAVEGALREEYVDAGGPASSGLGYPMADTPYPGDDTIEKTQSFQNGFGFDFGNGEPPWLVIAPAFGALPTVHDIGLADPEAASIATMRDLIIRWWGDGGPTSFEIARTVDNGPAQLVCNYSGSETGPIAGCVDQDVDTVVPVGGAVCYHARRPNGFGGYETTPEKCYITRDEQWNRRVRRAQLYVKVANISGAGTDYWVSARLQGRPTYAYFPKRHVTNMDSDVSDFGVNSGRTYDLTLDNVKVLSDITWIVIETKRPPHFIPIDDDPLCIERIALYVNTERTMQVGEQPSEDTMVFDKNYAPAQCVDLSTPLVIPTAELRAHLRWLAAPENIAQVNGPAVDSIAMAALAHRLRAQSVNGRVAWLTNEQQPFTYPPPPAPQGPVETFDCAGQQHSHKEFRASVEVHVPILPNLHGWIDFELVATSVCTGTDPYAARLDAYYKQADAHFADLGGFLLNLITFFQADVIYSTAFQRDARSGFAGTSGLLQEGAQFIMPSVGQDPDYIGGLVVNPFRPLACEDCVANPQCPECQ